MSLTVVVDGVKICPDCKRSLPYTPEFFYANNRDRKNGLSGYCKRCHSKHCTMPLKRDRKAAIAYYSQNKNCCNCCGETLYEFLAVDHINGGGNKHRQSLGRGSAFYRWLRQQGWPEGYQILCHNCNLAKGYYGLCPHQKGK